MKSVSFFLFLFIILSFSTKISAQESLGLKIEKFSGVNSLYMNPANTVFSPFKWDANIAGAGLFFDNNYIFVRNTNLIQVARNGENYTVATEVDNENEIPAGDLVIDFQDNVKRHYAHANVHILGPSFSYNLNNQHSFGFFTGFRTVVSAQKIPSVFNYKNIENIENFTEVTIDPFKVGVASWGEVGFNYSYNLNEGEYNQLALGANLKFLLPYEAAFVHNKSSLTFQVEPGDSIFVRDANIDFGLTTAAADQAENYSPTRNGMGIALDLGASYTIEGEEDGYRWKFGAALLDIGKLNFKNNAQQHNITTQDIVTIAAKELENQADVDEFTSELSVQSLSNSTLSLVDNQFSMWMPAALSLSADYSFNQNLFLYAGIVQRIPLPGAALERANSIALVPRFEHRWFGIALPMILYEGNDFRMGTSLRLGYLTIGTDNLGSFISKKDLTGTDFYFSLESEPF